MPWKTFIARRIAFALVGLAVLSMLVFFALEVVPGNVARTVLGPEATEEQVVQLSDELGLDRSPVVRYFEWFGGVIQGDMGHSLTLQTEVRPVALQAALNSLLLAFLAILVGVPLAIYLGFVAGMRRPPWADPVLSRLSVTIGALPEFLIATGLTLFFSISLGILPVTSVQPGASPISNPAGLVLPVATLTLAMLPYILRVTRAAVAGVADADFVVAAELKGLSQATVIRRHIAPNAMLPTITVVAGYLSWIAGGLVIVEAIFSYPGLGQLMFDAARDRDVPVLEATVLIIGAFRFLSNFAADACYRLLDPRVR